MQNCPITSPYWRCVFYPNIFEHAHTTKLYGGFYYKTVRGFFTRLHSGGLGVSNFFVGRSGLLPHSLTTRLHGGRGKQTPMPTVASLHTLQVTWSSYSVERAMEILLQDCTGARMLPNFTATFPFWLQDCTGTNTRACYRKLYGGCFFTTRLNEGHTHYQTARRRRARWKPPRWWLLLFPTAQNRSL